jgi:hypothetical protein
MRTIQTTRGWLWFLLFAGLLASCGPSTTPPGANTFRGSVQDTLYVYHTWQDGLAILVWHNFSYGSSGCRGTASTEDPVYRLACEADSQNGHRFEWEIHTRDGVSAQMWIDGDGYDLSQGQVFLVSSQDGETQVVQLQRDLSALAPDEAAISTWGQQDDEISDFIARTDIEAP